MPKGQYNRSTAQPAKTGGIRRKGVGTSPTRVQEKTGGGTNPEQTEITDQQVLNARQRLIHEWTEASMAAREVSANVIDFDTVLYMLRQCVRDEGLLHRIGQAISGTRTAAAGRGA